MKSTAIALLLILFTSPLFSQKVPDVVKEAFNKRFTGVSDVDWEVEKNYYQADFSHDNKYKTARFDQAGNWMETRVYIEEDELPAPVIKVIGDKFEEGFYESIMKVENNKKENYYDITLNVYDDVFLISVNAAGEILKSEIQQNNFDYEETEEDVD